MSKGELKIKNLEVVDRDYTPIVIIKDEALEKGMKKAKEAIQKKMGIKI